MQASLRSMVDIIGEPCSRFVIPIFQRVYSWSENQCDELFKDVMRSASYADGEVKVADEDLCETPSEGHFLGTVLVARTGGVEADGAAAGDAAADGAQADDARSGGRSSSLTGSSAW